MELAKIFQAVEETQFLKNLASQERLFLIGEAQPLEYIKDFMTKSKQSDRNYYYDLAANSLDNLSAIASEINLYQAIVVVSTKDENSLFQKVKSQCDLLGINIPTFRLFEDIFINLMCRQKLLKSTSKTLSKPQTTYAILTTPRSGSTFFCDLLSSTKIAGYPSEHLRLAAQELTKHCNFNYLRLLDNLMEQRVTSNEVFGTKFISHFLFEFQSAKPDFKQIFKSIDKFILLIRKDKVAQAVSLVLAQKTEVWHLRQNDTANNQDFYSYKSKLEDLKIDDDLLLEVEQKHTFIQNQEARLRKILKANNQEALEIVYEDIVEDAASQIDRVLKFIGVVPPAGAINNVNSGIKKMPSSISQEIIRQYKRKKSTVS